MIARPEVTGRKVAIAGVSMPSTPIRSRNFVAGIRFPCRSSTSSKRKARARSPFTWVCASL